MEAKKQKLDQSIFKLTSNKSNCTLKATFFQLCDSQRIVNSNSGHILLLILTPKTENGL